MSKIMKNRVLIITVIAFTYLMLISNILAAQNSVRDFPYDNPFFGWGNPSS